MRPPRCQRRLRAHTGSGKQLGQTGCHVLKTSPRPAAWVLSKVREQATRNPAEASKEPRGLAEAWECPDQVAKALGAAQSHLSGDRGSLVCKCQGSNLAAPGSNLSQASWDFHCPTLFSVCAGDTATPILQIQKPKLREAESLLKAIQLYVLQLSSKLCLLSLLARGLGQVTSSPRAPVFLSVN